MFSRSSPKMKSRSLGVNRRFAKQESEHTPPVSACTSRNHMRIALYTHSAISPFSVHSCRKHSYHSTSPQISSQSFEPEQVFRTRKLITTFLSPVTQKVYIPESLLQQSSIFTHSGEQKRMRLRTFQRTTLIQTQSRGERYKNKYETHAKEHSDDKLHTKTIWETLCPNCKQKQAELAHRGRNALEMC